MKMVMILIASLVCFSASGVSAKTAHLGGYLQIGKNPIIVTKENFKRAAFDVAKAPNGKMIRMLALVDSSFDPMSVSQYGWRFKSWITNEIISLEGSQETAKFLTALDGLKYANIPFKITPCADDSVRKLSFLNEVYGNGTSNLPKVYKGDGVLVGIMETEFDTHHPAFLDSLGNSRFVAIWDQKDTSGPKPTYGYGTIKNRAQIQADSNFALSSTEIHGTWVAGIAAGSQVGTIPFYGVAPKASLIGVRYSGNNNDLADGIKWIFKVADSLKLPCVINMSIGLQEGPHDGSSIIDRTIDSLSASGKIIVGAAGNDGDTKVHIGFTLARNEVKGTWASGSKFTDDAGRERIAAGFDMWGKSGIYYSGDFYVIDTTTMVYHQLQPVIATSTTAQTADTLYVTDSISKRKDTIFFYTLAEKKSALNSKVHLEAVMVSSNPNMLFGVKLSHTSTSSDTINAWNIYKHSFVSLGLSGYYDADTLMSIDEVGGTAKRNITVGSYVSSLDIKLWDGTSTGPAGYAHERNAYSSMGPTADGRIKPDIMAPGCRIACPHSRAGSDEKVVIWPDHANKHGRYTYSEGTSFAAPVVTGVVALMLQIKPTLTPEEAKQVLQATAYTDSYTGTITSVNNSWGAGKLNALKALQTLAGVTQNRFVNAVDDKSFSVKAFKNSIILSGAVTDRTKPEIEWYTLSGKMIASQIVDFDKVITFPETAGSQVFILKVKAMSSVKSFLLKK